MVVQWKRETSLSLTWEGDWEVAICHPISAFRPQPFKAENNLKKKKKDFGSVDFQSSFYFFYFILKDSFYFN